jgi:hypothetical protein
MKRFAFLAVVACLCGCALPGTGRADIITYEYKTSLSLSSGTDALGLNGATVDIKVDVSSSEGYGAIGFVVGLLMNNDATITISGSSIVANNVTLALPQEVFFPTSVPTSAGLFTLAAQAQVTSLPVGGSLTTDLRTFPTTHGSAVLPGDTVNILDFAPATSQGFAFSGSNGAIYSQVNPTVTATQSTAVPEPASLTLLAIGGVGLLGYGWRQRKRAAA